MCHLTVCRTCGKPTWFGCGRHVEEVMREVPPDRRCQCKKSWLARLFGL